MSAPFAADEIELFRAAIAAKCGMTFGADRSMLLDGVLKQRLSATGCGPVAEYLRLLAAGPGEAAELAKLLTVSETYFLRNIEQFRAVSAYLAVLRETPDRRLRILSAGCSSGEEAYSAAIVVRENLADVGRWNVAIRGVDLNPEVLRKAKLASYSTWSLRETPLDLRERHFTKDGAGFRLNANIRDMVAFEQRNLLEPDPVFWQRDSYHVVFCRNVLMYLTTDAAATIVGRIAEALKSGGLLFLGHAENLRGLSEDFRLRHSHGTFYYERRGDAAVRMPHEIADDGRAPRAEPQRVAEPAWIAAIERSAARVTALAIPSPSSEPAALAPSAARDALRPPDPPAAAALPPRDALSLLHDRSGAAHRGVLMAALELIGYERFTDALATLGTLPEIAWRDPDALLLKAVVLTCGGQPSAAEKVCADLLALDELSASAHYVMALCREHAGDVAGAIHHHETSIYLDAEFAMPRLHLGRLMRRRRELLAARRELECAASLLAREDAARIVLFGGGFTREALIALCRAERDACASAA
jgi:chemotaxis protein methyltransferase CheR